jgi:urease accessory protein UreE
VRGTNISDAFMRHLETRLITHVNGYAQAYVISKNQGGTLCWQIGNRHRELWACLQAQ